MSVSFSGIFNNLFKVEEWNVGVVRLPISDFLKPDGEFNISWLAHRRGRSLADPFGLVRDDRLFMLCEEFDPFSKGKIICYEETVDHSFSKYQVSLELPFHVSYPYLVESGGEVYCVPETNEAHEVALYRATDFPRAWREPRP